MSNPNVSWDIQDQNDRIISMLAWVVVVVLVLYACIYFYKQARGVAERPGRTPDARLASGGTVGAPPVTGALRLERPAASAAPELVVPGDNTRVVSHRPVVRPSPATPLARVPLATDPEVGIGTPPTSSSGYAVRIGKPHPTPQDAQKELFKLPVVVQDINFIQEGASWVLQVGKYRTLEEAKAFVKRIQPHIASAEIIALDAPAAAPAPVRTAARPAPEPAKPAKADRRTTRAADEARAARATRPAARAKADAVARGAEKRGRTRPVLGAQGAQRPVDRGEDRAGVEAGVRGEAPAYKKKLELALATDGSEETGDASEGSDVAALTPDARALSREARSDAGERGVLGAMTTGDGDDERPVRARRRADAAIETDEDGEVDASPRPRSPGAVAAELKSAAREAPVTGHFSVQVGAFASEDKARAVAGQLRSSGLAARVDEAVTGDSTIYRVRVGKYGNNREAQAEKRRIAGELGYADVRVIVD